ncbi:MAG: peptidase C45 [Rhizobiales bacterium]|nr:peptidase C45 [Hyphomicrobiales bacterium]OJY07895.1 MAG: hypothetical protein BGP07_02085 [Rhizobiales bacterium 63-22]
MNRVPFFDLVGTSYQRGHHYGAAAKAKIDEFLRDGLARLDAFQADRPILADFEQLLMQYGESISRQTPELFVEITGIAKGAQIPVSAAMLLQCRRELAGYSRFTTTGDCTTYADLRRKPILAQTIDLAGDMEDQICVLRNRNNESGRTSLLVSFTGLLGYLGLNDRGLAIGINLVLGGQWRPGIPPYLLIRHLLDTASSVEEAIELLADFDIASSRCFVLCDRTQAAEVEIVNGNVYVRRGNVIAHTNHFLNPQLTKFDELNVFARNGSVRRLTECRRWLDEHHGRAKPEEILDFLSKPPLFVPDRGDRGREKTVAAVVLLPAKGTIYLRPTDPNQSNIVRFNLETLDQPDYQSAAGEIV